MTYWEHIKRIFRRLPWYQYMYWLLGTLPVVCLYITSAIAVVPTIIFLPISYQAYRLTKLATWPYDYVMCQRKMTGFNWVYRIIWGCSFGFVYPICHAICWSLTSILSCIPHEQSKQYFQTLSDIHYTLSWISSNPFNR
eukprot:UN29742